jgi:hypothetical protein
MNLNIFKVMSQFKDLEKEKASLLSQLELAQKDLVDAQNVIGDFMVKQKEFDVKIETITKEHEAKVTELESQLAAEKNSAIKKAASLMSSLGVEPDSIKETVTAAKLSLVKQFEKLEGKERTEFYTKYKTEICKELGILK